MIFWCNDEWQGLENVLHSRHGLSHHSTGLVEMCYWNQRRFCSSGLNINQIFCFQIVRSQNRMNRAGKPSSSAPRTQTHAYVRDIYCWMSCIDLVSSCLRSFSLPVGAARKRCRLIAVRVNSSHRCRRVGSGGRGCPSVDDFSECVIASHQVGKPPATLQNEKNIMLTPITKV